MRKLTRIIALALPLLPWAGASQASDVRVGVTVAGQVSPGVYGRIEIGNQPPPPVVYTKPVVIVQQPTPVYAAPDARGWETPRSR